MLDDESVTNDNRLLANRLPLLNDSYLVHRRTVHVGTAHTLLSRFNSQMMTMTMMMVMVPAVAIVLTGHNVRASSSSS